MKKSNAQAELLSQPGELLRTSRPLRSHCAEQHSKDLRALRGSSAPFFLFLFRLQAQAHSNRVKLLQGSRA